MQLTCFLYESTSFCFVLFCFELLSLVFSFFFLPPIPYHLGDFLSYNVQPWFYTPAITFSCYTCLMAQQYFALSFEMKWNTSELGMWCLRGSEALTGSPEASKREATAGCREGQSPVLVASARSRIPPDRPKMAAPQPETLPPHTK